MENPKKSGQILSKLLSNAPENIKNDANLVTILSEGHVYYGNKLDRNFSCIQTRTYNNELKYSLNPYFSLPPTSPL